MLLFVFSVILSYLWDFIVGLLDCGLVGSYWYALDQKENDVEVQLFMMIPVVLELIFCKNIFCLPPSIDPGSLGQKRLVLILILKE